MWDAPYQHGKEYSGSWAAWKEHKTLFVSFQQTVQKKDWMQNFKIFPIKTAYGKIHEGFYQQFKEIYFLAFKELLENIEDVDRVIVCGWSQGAVLASLFYNTVFPCLQSLGLKNKCILYGMPNFVKKQSLDKWIKSPNYSVTEFQHACDLFTFLPLGYTKPVYTKLVFGKPFSLIKAVLKIRECHTSYIDFCGDSTANIEV